MKPNIWIVTKLSTCLCKMSFNNLLPCSINEPFVNTPIFIFSFSKKTQSSMAPFFCFYSFLKVSDLDWLRRPITAFKFAGRIFLNARNVLSNECFNNCQTELSDLTKFCPNWSFYPVIPWPFGLENVPYGLKNVTDNASSEYQVLQRYRLTNQKGL